MSADIRPIVADGVPRCSAEACPSFDGKRCRLTGFRPGTACEPAVSALAADLAEAAGLLRRAEWSGSAGRCPWCKAWPATGPTDGLGNDTHDGHEADCPHVAFFARVSP